MITDVVEIEKFEGYEIRKEWTWNEGQENKKVLLHSAYTPTGDYMGDPPMAWHLVKVLGIAPELRTEHSNTCTIGYSATLDKWFGWSHRAICGFGIGDKLFDVDYPEGTETTPFIEYGDITIQTLEQARQAAVNFAEHV